jgi:kynureninase
MNFENTAEYAAAMDAADPLASFRDRFLFPLDAEGQKALYFTGNSLGLQPRTVREYINQELDDWATYAVDGHLHARHPWLPYHEFLAGNMAEVVGALPGEVVVMNSLTVNLHLMMVSFYRRYGKRCKIVIEKGAFPSDQYAVRSQVDFHARSSDETPSLMELAPRPGESTLRTEDIVATIRANADEIALILLGGVNYYTGQAFDMEAITRAGHEAGAVVAFDCAHAAGNLELKLHDWDVDFAVWCNYKYLNAGPGAIAGVFVHERHAERFDLPRFAGWWGHDKQTRFLMGDEFRPMRGAEGWQVSNPQIFQMAALRASLEVFHDAGMDRLRAKSLKLTGFLEFLLRKIETDRIEIITPSDPQQRGCQLSIRVRNADRALFDRITAHGVFADWREPDVIRVAPAPLYNSFSDVFGFAAVLRRCLQP